MGRTKNTIITAAFLAACYGGYRAYDAVRDARREVEVLGRDIANIRESVGKLATKDALSSASGLVKEELKDLESALEKRISDAEKRLSDRLGSVDENARIARSVAEAARDDAFKIEKQASERAGVYENDGYRVSQATLDYLGKTAVLIETAFEMELRNPKNAKTPPEKKWMVFGYGSGTVIGEDEVLTNHHCIDTESTRLHIYVWKNHINKEKSLDEITSAEIVPTGNKEIRVYNHDRSFMTKAKVKDLEKEMDIALLQTEEKLKDTNKIPVNKARTELVKPGDYFVNYGLTLNPQGSRATINALFEVKKDGNSIEYFCGRGNINFRPDNFGHGVVSSKDKDLYLDYKIIGGDSGSPVYVFINDGNNDAIPAFLGIVKEYLRDTNGNIRDTRLVKAGDIDYFLSTKDDKVERNPFSFPGYEVVNVSSRPR